MQPTQDLNVRATIPLVSPRLLKADLPMSEAANRTIVQGREAVKRVIAGDDRRLMVVVGPCSVHDPQAGLQYARQLRQLADKVKDRLLVLMRVYFEKPRTTVGWKGLINDPHMNDTFDIDAGFRVARRILLEVAEMGLPVATEILEPITPQYIADLITVAAIGARTTESPTHRQMASGLSMPVGFKNGTDGDPQVAIDAMSAARSSHGFIGIDPDGSTCVVHTKGNPWGFLILRGGRSGPNYQAEHLATAAQRLNKEGLYPRIVIDCSHANSNKDHRRQAVVWNDVVEQRLAGGEAIAGMMLESNLFEGKQTVGGNDLSALRYGVSITDACIGWDETEQLILDAHAKLATECVTS